ncbi:MAG: hypothetical protein K2N38_00635 [Oscillospiraceae bacterium]|nr:hypothetical protein [Oscillospiraceae bacterium]
MKLKEYEVLYVEQAENTVYVCRKPSETGLYRVIETADRTRIAKYIRYFAACNPREFYEDFCLNEKYYAVFFAPDGIPLKASGETLTAQKAARALAMQNPPLEIAVNILSRDHIFICGDELEFAYDLPETDIKITRDYFFGRLADFMNSFLETGADRNVEKWLTDLRGGRFDDLLTAYRCMPSAGEETEISDKERFKKIKAALPKIAAVIAAAAIITAAALALDQSGEEPEYSRIDSLGTIDLTKQ